MAEDSTLPYKNRSKALWEEFTTKWSAQLKEISTYLLTRKGRFLDKDTTPNDGNRRNDAVIDATGGRALRILAAGMQSGLTSPARPWFRLGLEDTDLQDFRPVRIWLDEVRSRMMSVFSKSNFYTAVHSVYGELGGFGTASMLIEEDFANVIRCYPYTVGEYVIATDASGRVDTHYRQFEMTTTNMVSFFGIDNVSSAVATAFKSNQKDAWHKIIHGIEPNAFRIPDKEDLLNKKWKSVYIEVSADSNKFLRQSGYDDFPVMAPRWDVTGSEVYGRSPGMDVLPDVMMLQRMQTDKLKALDKVVDPPMNAPSTLRDTGGGSIVSGGVTYIDTQQGNQGFEPTYQIRPDIGAMQSAIFDVQTSIKEGLFNDLFLMLALSSNKEMTAREVAERHEEKLLTVGPVVERLQPELLDRVIDRTYNIMDRKIMFPEPPPELDGMDLQVEYISLLAQAQKMVGVTAIESTAAFVAGLTEGGWPEARHKFDPLAAIDEYADMVGTPATLINSDESVEDKLAAEAAEVARAQQAENAERLAQGAETLSKADMGSDNALTRMTGGNQSTVPTTGA